CSAPFETKEELLTHKRKHRKYNCEDCKRKYNTLKGFQNHALKYHYVPSDLECVVVPTEFYKASSSFHGYVSAYTHRPTTQQDNFIQFLDNIRPKLSELLTNVLRVLGNLKFQLCVQGVLQKLLPDDTLDDITTNIFLQTQP